MAHTTLGASAGLNLQTDATVRIPSTASNGTTRVSLVAGSGTTIVYPTTLKFYNSGAVSHVVKVWSDTLPTFTGLQFQIAPGGDATFDGRGDIRTIAGEALSFSIDMPAGAVAGDVTASGSAVQK